MQYFNNLRKFQEINDQKHQMLSNYLIEDMNSIAKKDEASYIKAVTEKEEQQRRKDEEEARKLLKTKQYNMDSLNF